MEHVLDVLATECEAMGRGLSDVGRADPAEWDLPTRCAPWSVRELLGHVCVVLGWVPGMLAGEAPGQAEISAVQYYRADHRFDAAANVARIDLGRERVGELPVSGLMTEFDGVWRDVVARCRRERGERVARTRHGDAMLLTDFLATRVVEVAVHGLDLADALGREPWLTDPAADLVTGLLTGDGDGGGHGDGDGPDRAAALGWDRARLLRKATGREPLSVAESERLAEVGIRRLALG